jgi:hypothetical protein
MKRSLQHILAGFFLVAAASVGLPPLLAAETADDAEAEIKEALAKLPAADRAAAEAQRYCPVMQDHRLGSMGAPVKVTVDGQAVFVCCKSCGKKAASNAKATLAAVKKLKKVAAALTKLAAADRKSAEEQRFCAVESENLLGSMGKPVKLVIQGQPVFLCCASCQDSAKADPRKTLAKVKELKSAKQQKE